MPVVIDSRAYARSLQNAGFTDQQVEALTRALATATCDRPAISPERSDTWATAATRSDLSLLESRCTRQFFRMAAEMGLLGFVLWVVGLFMVAMLMKKS